MCLDSLRDGGRLGKDRATLVEKAEKGYLALVLHAHLPYVRHPEYEYSLEENWLFEAITETYIPLLRVMENLVDEGFDFRLNWKGRGGRFISA